MATSTLWKHTKDPYELFQLVLENPRIPQIEFARIFHVNRKTANIWWHNAIDYGIIIPPVFKRKSFLNFREHFYFIRVNNPHSLYEKFKDSKDISYYSVQTGFANFQIIAEKPLSLNHEVVLSGERSDYFVSIPPNCTFEKSISLIEEKLKNLDKREREPTPLVYHAEEYTPWDELDEVIYQRLCNSLRSSFTDIIETTGAYSDKIMDWFRTREKFGQDIVMFFPKGESAYLLSLFCIDTEKENDSILIDIFSKLPTSNVFYRIGEKLMMSIYLPFLPGEGGRFIIRKTLDILEKKELVSSYTNSIVEYGYRP